MNKDEAKKAVFRMKKSLELEKKNQSIVKNQLLSQPKKPHIEVLASF